MSKFDEFFHTIKDGVDKDLQQRTPLQDLEHQFYLQLIPYKNFVYKLASYNPSELCIQDRGIQDPNPAISKLLSEFSLSLFNLDSEESRKKPLLNKFIEECIVLVLTFRYFQVIDECFNMEGSTTIQVPMVGNHDSTGVIVNTNELPDILNLEKVDYQVYLSALVRLIDTMVEYTNGTVIRGSIQSKGPYGKDYSIAMVNLEIALKLEKGFQSLEFNNENLRKLYDGLKLNCQKLSKMTYDLSLRNLINVKGETV